MNKDDNFELGFYWGLYNDLEKQFSDFLEYVPYLPGNEYVYSFKLWNLLLGIGSHVDSAFKDMAKFEDFKEDPKCQEIIQRTKDEKIVPISLTLPTFEKFYHLSEIEVFFLPPSARIYSSKSRYSDT